MISKWNRIQMRNWSSLKVAVPIFRRLAKTAVIPFLCGLLVSFFALWISFHLIPQPDEDTSVADRLGQKVRIFCWVMTQPKNHGKLAKAVKATWGRRCNKLVFVSSANDTDLPAIDAQVPEGRQHLWGKTRFGFRNAYQSLNEYDWFYKADDDTFAILENMRFLLSHFDPNDPVFLGSRFRRHVRNGYMSGGAGYVLSRESLRRLVEDGLEGGKCTSRTTSFAEDVEVAKCLQKLKVLAGDSRDELKRNRFFPFLPSTHLAPSLHRKLESAWYWKTAFFPEKEGPECCSNKAISFHYVKHEKMYEMEYLIYRLRPHGIILR